MTLLDRRVVDARRSDAGGRDPPGRGRPDLLVATERVAHDRSDLAREVGRQRERRVASVGRQPEDRRDEVEPRCGLSSRESSHQHDRIDPATGVGRRGDAHERPARGRCVGHLARARGQEGSGTGVDRRVDRGRVRRPRRSPRQAGRQRRPPSGRSRRTGNSRAGRGSSERVSPAGRSSGANPSGRSAAKPADAIEDALDVVGGFAGLDHRDGDIDERLERRRAARSRGRDRWATGARGGDRWSGSASRGDSGTGRVRSHRRPGGPPSAAAAGRCDAATSGRRSAMARATASSGPSIRLRRSGRSRPVGRPADGCASASVATTAARRAWLRRSRTGAADEAEAGLCRPRRRVDEDRPDPVEHVVRRQPPGAVDPDERGDRHRNGRADAAAEEPEVGVGALGALVVGRCERLVEAREPAGPVRGEVAPERGEAGIEQALRAWPDRSTPARERCCPSDRRRTSRGWRGWSRRRLRPRRGARLRRRGGRGRRPAPRPRCV